MIAQSALAIQTGFRRRSLRRTRSIWGVVVRTSAEEDIIAALEHGADPLEALVTSYLRPRATAPHYLIGWNGDVVQICDEDQKAEDLALEPAHRRAYLDGSWTQLLPSALVSGWQQRWPDTPSPAHLFPGLSPDQVYIAIELLPLVAGVVARPMASASRHTVRQHEAAVALAKDIGDRRDFVPMWSRSGRLVAEEDLHPLRRSPCAVPGRDPGNIDATGEPCFDVDWLRRQLDRAVAAPELEQAATNQASAS